MRKTLASVIGVVLVTLAAVGAAGAAPNSARTVLNDVPTSGQTLNVTFTVFGTAPVVPYDYALQNTCTLTGGHFTLGQFDLIAAWTDHDANGNPQVTMPVYLQSVPSGASCRVSLVTKNTVVKGSTKSYTVG
jgi:hypothetical protein